MPGHAPGTHSKPCLAATAVASLLLAALFFYASWLAPTLVQRQLDQGVRDSIIWRPDSPDPVDARFRGLPDPDAPPDYLRVYLWNVTNVSDIRAGYKPVLEQVGPFTYIKHRVKVDAWWDREGRVAVKEWDYHLHVPELSAFPLDTPITTLNLPLLGVMEALHAAVGPTYQTLLDLVVAIISAAQDKHVDGLFTTRTANELIWGYQDPLLKRLASLLPAGMIPTTHFELLHNMTSVEEALALAPTLINTGAHDISKVWNIEVDGGWTLVSSWNNCSETVNGSDAFQFHPNLSREDHLRVWVRELFRSAMLTFVQDVQLQGINLFRFKPDPNEALPNTCHNQRLTGLSNVTVPMAVGPTGDPAAAHGPRLYLSLPHFCKCDPQLSKELEGLACDLERHVTFLDIEPVTGVTMRAAKRLQLSTEMTDTARQHIEARINRSIIIPVFWVEESSEISKPLADGFKASVYRAHSVIKSLRKWPIVAGGFCLLLAFLMAWAIVVLYWTEAQHERQLQRSTDPVSTGSGSTAGDDLTAPLLHIYGGGRSKPPSYTGAPITSAASIAHNSMEPPFGVQGPGDSVEETV